MKNTSNTKDDANVNIGWTFYFNLFIVFVKSLWFTGIVVFSSLLMDDVKFVFIVNTTNTEILVEFFVEYIEALNIL